MGLLSDNIIRTRVELGHREPEHANRLVIEPFSEELVKEPGCPSWGLSCYGYDLRLAGVWQYLDTHGTRSTGQQWIDPAHPGKWIEITGEYYDLPPQGFILGMSIEYVRIPRDCGAAVMGKSSWARLGLNLNTTLLEPEWEGTVTLELANIGEMPIRLTAGVGICQMVLSRGELHNRALPMLGNELKMSYADRQNPTYQHQKNVTPARV